MKRKNYGQVFLSNQAVRDLFEATYGKAVEGSPRKPTDPDPFRELAMRAELHKEYADGNLDSRITRAATWVKSQMRDFCVLESYKYFDGYSVTNRSVGQCVEKTNTKGKTTVHAVYRDGAPLTAVLTEGDDTTEDDGDNPLFISADDMEGFLLRNIVFKIDARIEFATRDEHDDCSGNPGDAIKPTEGDNLYPVVHINPKGNLSKMDEGETLDAVDADGNEVVITAAEVNAKIDDLMEKHRVILDWISDTSSRREKNPADFRNAALLFN